MKGKVLTIAGSDSGGGAGIQADIKTITSLKAYASSVITALTAQNTLGVQQIYPIPKEFVAQQINSVLDDIGADCIKTGMLPNKEVIQIVASCISKYAKNATPLVLDPVMFAKGGTKLIEENAIDGLINNLIPLSTIITPNIPEAEYLSKTSIKTTQHMVKAAKIIQSLGAKNVLIKGGHLDGNELTNILLTEGGNIVSTTTERIETKNTHGTGCTMASAIATLIAQGSSTSKAAEDATKYVHKAISEAPEIGSGHGPLNHTCII